MSDAVPAISVTSGATRQTQREQLETHLAGVAERKEEVVRLRIPVTLYNPPVRGYVDVRDGAWNLQLPAGTTPEQIEDLIQAVGVCIDAIAKQGSAAVREKLA